MKNTLLIISCLIISCLLSIFGCAGFGEKKGEFVPEITVKYSEDIEADKFWPDRRLKERFELYWKLRWSGEADVSFELEAPYFQEMASIERYRKYVKANKSGVSMTLKEHVQETERLHFVQCTVQLEFCEEMRDVSFLDGWIYVGNEWYHVLRDILLFPDES